MKTNSVLTLREASQITRYHTARTLREQNVAAHSWGVAHLVLTIYPMASNELLRACIVHDLPELETGDAPAPVKWRNGKLKQMLTDIEDQFNEKHGTDFSLSDLEFHVLKWCDMAELCLWAAEEVTMGNQYMRAVYSRGVDYLAKLGHPTTAARRLFIELLQPSPEG